MNVTYVSIPLQDWEILMSRLEKMEYRIDLTTKSNEVTYSIKEVASIVKKSEAAVRKWIDSGKLAAAISKNGNSKKRTIFVRKNDLDKFLNANNQKK